MEKHRRLSQNVDVWKSRRNESAASAVAAVKVSGSILYDRKWGKFRKFCMDRNIQEGMGVFDPEGFYQPCLDVVIKIVEFFYYKVV